VGGKVFTLAAEGLAGLLAERAVPNGDRPRSKTTRRKRAVG
jgi:hypothetical protein